MKTVLLSLFIVLGVVTAAPMPPGDLLASNKLVATFEGISDLPCRFRTSQCPIRCGHAKKLAKFKVLENLKYVKDGLYGDAKAMPGSIVYVNVTRDIEGQDLNVAKRISKMNPGAKVQLSIKHYYVNKSGSRYPIRPTTSLKLLPSCK